MFRSIIPFLSVILLLCSCGKTHFTAEETALINSAGADAPFRVLLISDKADSLTLRAASRDITSTTDDADLQRLIARLKTTMAQASGVGIAAPQVGISRNVFLFTRIDKKENPIVVAINPKIRAHSDETFVFERDGCLSIPDMSGNSLRYCWIEVEYTDETGKVVRERLEGGSRFDDFTGVIFQHEFDHLQGVLFIDKLAN